MNKNAGLLAGLMAATWLVACTDQRSADVVTVATPASDDDGAAAAAATTQMVDVIESSPTQIVGISYPHDAGVPAGLAKVLQDYAAQARTELDAALEELGNDKPRVPYELSLSFSVSADTPELLAVSADGSRYTGGAHGQPLTARFVWLKQQARLLSVEELIASAESRDAIAAYVQQQLLEQMEQRLAADKLSDSEQAMMRSNAREMITEGTAQGEGNFSQFLPVVDRDGQVSAVRFVFPPYQVGPYSDGTQSVDVPVAVLLPHLAADYRHLFSPPIS